MKSWSGLRKGCVGRSIGGKPAVSPTSSIPYSKNVVRDCGVDGYFFRLKVRIDGDLRKVEPLNVFFRNDHTINCFRLIDLNRCRHRATLDQISGLVARNKIG